jgi:thiosulfate/3-mercaptopyruvate sulfurtransferase
MAMDDFGPLVSPEWLREHLDDPDLRVIDFRWYLDGRRGLDAYAQGHIPGAVFVDLEAVTGAEGPGRHPLPSDSQFATEMRKAGVTKRTSVVAYDDVGGAVAARLWFLLRWFGHGSQAVLDGGIRAWGSPQSSEMVTVTHGSFTSTKPDRHKIATFDELQGRAGVLIDTRLAERYRGDTEPIDPKAGHVPGARNAPWTGNLGPNGRFKARDELRKRFVEIGVVRGEDAVVYCGSGVNACHNLLALELAGLGEARLYEGSWSDWSRRDLPVATANE